MISAGFLVRVTGFEPAASWSQDRISKITKNANFLSRYSREKTRKLVVYKSENEILNLIVVK